MSKKNESFYFDNFIDSAAISCEMAERLKLVLQNFSPDNLPRELAELHEIEHRGDAKKHEVIRRLVRAFITPVDRDDIIKISENIDNVTDSIEDIILHIYINNVSEIRDGCIEFADIIIECCMTMQKMLQEFKNFKKSKSLSKLIIELNQIEEKGDALYLKLMRELHLTSSDPLDIFAWHEIYGFFEKSCDACETVADIIESIAIENT